MTKDFKQQIAADSSFGQYGLSWMLGGIGIGLLVGVGMYAIANKGNQTTTTTPPAAVSSTAPNASASVTPNAASRDAATTSIPPENTANPAEFSYHAVLPQLEVDVPIAVHDDAAKAAKTATTPATKPAPATETPTAEVKPSALPTGFNGLQIGSYKTEEQALAMQNRLKRSGLQSQTVKATVHGETWFRVRVGPVSDAATLNKWQQTLSGMGISALPVRM